MQSFHHLSFSPFLVFSLLLLSSFHGQQLLANAQAVFTNINSASLSPLQHGSVDSSGTLTLDSTTGDALAFYSTPISLVNTISQSVISFTSFFTFASNVTNGNGTIAFVIMPDATETTNLTEARKTLTIEFNTNCSTGVFDGSSFYGGHGFAGRGGGYMGGRGRGYFNGGLGGFQVVEYANSISIPSQAQGGYGPNFINQSYDQSGPYFCNQQTAQDLTNPTFQYQVVVEYNASTDTMWVGSPSCGDLIARTTQFASQDLSTIITTPVHVGFLVSGGGVFKIPQWNFTSNVTTSSVLSLALSSVVSPSSGSSSSDGSTDGGRGHSDGGSKLKKGYVIGFSVLGAAIGIAAVLLVCCLCARKKRVTSARFVAKGVHAGTIPESAVVFDAKKPHAAPARVVLVDRDTTPLNTHPNSASTGATSWLQPVAPR